MKYTANDYNPLSDILALIPSKTPVCTYMVQLLAINILLEQGGITCESQEDTVKVLELLADINVVEIQYETINKIKYFKLGNKINGQ